MEQSTALQELYVKSCEAQVSGDYAFFEQHFSQQDGVLAIGTDPAEWWPGYGTITKVFTAQLKETGGFQIEAGEAMAYVNGSVGWIAGQPVVQLPDGQRIPFRLTIVCQQEQGDWKIVQWHFSAGVANEDLIGETLTTE